MDQASLEAEVESLKINQALLWEAVRDMQKRFDTLQTPMWKRIWFRIDGWPGVRDLNGKQKQRFWH